MAILQLGGNTDYRAQAGSVRAHDSTRCPEVGPRAGLERWQVRVSKVPLRDTGVEIEAGLHR